MKKDGASLFYTLFLVFSFVLGKTQNVKDCDLRNKTFFRKRSIAFRNDHAYYPKF